MKYAAALTLALTLALPVSAQPLPDDTPEAMVEAFIFDECLPWALGGPKPFQDAPRREYQLPAEALAPITQDNHQIVTFYIYSTRYSVILTELTDRLRMCVITVSDSPHSPYWSGQPFAEIELFPVNPDEIKTRIYNQAERLDIPVLYNLDLGNQTEVVNFRSERGDSRNIRIEMTIGPHYGTPSATALRHLGVSASPLPQPNS